MIRGRMDRASHELSHWAEYDYIVVNQNVDEAFVEVQSILKAERLKRARRVGLTEFVRNLHRQLEKALRTRRPLTGPRIAFAAIEITGGRGSRSSSGGIDTLGVNRGRNVRQPKIMLMITPNTDSPPATMVISIGNDSGFSDAVTDGTARGMTSGVRPPPPPEQSGIRRSAPSPAQLRSHQY